MVLISFEGGDRCGKSTQISLLYKRLIDRNVNVILLKHPDRSTSSGKIIDQFLKREIDLPKESVTLCLTSNLWDTFFQIEKHLIDGKVVLIDRYIHTNLAYSQLRGINLKKLSVMMEGIKLPDLIVYLRPDDTRDVSNRNEFGNERYETIEFQDKVKENFDELFQNYLSSSCIILNSKGTIEDISNEIWNEIEKIKIV